MALHGMNDIHKYFKVKLGEAENVQLRVFLSYKKINE